MSETVFDIRRDDALSADALAMIQGSEDELAALYDPSVRFAFSPAELIDHGVRFFVAYRGGAPVGCGGVAPCDGYGELKRIFVAKPHRGSGAAAAILAELEGQAREMGLSLMRLETGLASPEAIRFYEKSGYARRAPFGAYQENGSSVFMEKAL